MSATYTTPKFMSSLARLAKENRVSNKEVKAKMAAKLQRAKDIQRQRTLAIKMDKELTKLEQIAAKEEAKQAKMEAKHTKQSKTKTQAGNNDRHDIIRSICEKLGAGHIHENQSVIV